MGFSFLGAVHALQYLNVVKFENINNFVGSSVGAIIVLLLYLGYSPFFVFRTLFDVNFEDSDSLCSFEDILNFPKEKGLLDAHIISDIVATFLEYEHISKNVTFEELANIVKTKTNKLQKLYIAGLNISKGETETFSIDSTPNMCVLLALRISICIPILFRPVKFQNCYYIDGAYLQNSLFQQFFEGNKNKDCRAVLIESYTKMQTFGINDYYKKEKKTTKDGNLKFEGSKEVIMNAASPNTNNNIHEKDNSNTRKLQTDHLETTDIFNNEDLIGVIQMIEQLFNCNSIYSRTIQRQLVDNFSKNTNSIRFSIPVENTQNSLNFFLSREDRIKIFKSGFQEVDLKWTETIKKQN